VGKSIESEVQSPIIPIWESAKSEEYSSSPGLTRFVIWRYNSNEEGVKKYTAFDALDPLPHHYYKSDDEYRDALKSYKLGVYPDKRVDVNVFFAQLEKSTATEVLEIVVFPETRRQEKLIQESKAA
jgi:hypothetical protein